MKAKYMIDSYIKEFETTVKSVKDKFVVLEDTIFYPNSGGQPHDTGKIIRENEEFNVVYVGKFNGQISHEVDKEGLKPEDKVICQIDWQRRYAHMRYHTTAHIISGVLHRESGALITGNQISQEKLRIDFNMDNFDRDALQNYIDIANKEIEKNIDVQIGFIDKEEALKIPGMVKLAGAMPPDIDELRTIKIEGVDYSADGGTHVKNTKELGKIELIKAENKGKSNRRIYLKFV